MVMTATVSEHDEKTLNETLWDRRYRKEGPLWTWEPSPTVQELTSQNIGSVAQVLEFGFGYGRDLLEIATNGHVTYGVEQSTVGLGMALDKFKEIGVKSTLVFGEIQRAPLQDEYFDALHSHRVLHLLGDNGVVRAFANASARFLKKDGVLCVSARDKRDFDPEQMEERDDGTVAYKEHVPNRAGHIISMWDQARFEATFSRKFNIVSILEEEEMESVSNPDKTSKFTIMVARRKDASPQVVSLGLVSGPAV